jgi:hypothetical protein
VNGLKHQMEKRSMEHFAGLDVSVNETSVYIVDSTGKIVREVKAASEPDALLAVLKSGVYRFKRIGLEVGPLSQQDRSQRRPRHRADDASAALSSGACEDVAQPEAAHVADPPQAAAVEGHCDRG